MSRPQHQAIADFPPLENANHDGLLAIGGDLSAERLISAYRQGIFPWYSADQPILWWSPDPRCILKPEAVKISRSLDKSLRNAGFTCSLDHDFAAVIRACAENRKQQPGTWITTDMIDAYCQLQQLGIAHSVEVYQDNHLVGGLYGLALGGVFFGESMFSKQRDASKVALVKLSRLLADWNFSLIDCQVTSDHLLTLGAEEMPRAEFQQLLHQGLQHNGQPGSWRSFAL